MRAAELVATIGIWTTGEEQALLEKVKHPVRLAALTEREQVCALTLIRKGLLDKIGTINPLVHKNAQHQAILQKTYDP